MQSAQVDSGHEPSTEGANGMIPTYKSSSMEEIEENYTTLQARFKTRITHTLSYRLYNLKQLAYLITDNETRIRRALEVDLGRDDFVLGMTETWPILNEIDLAVRRVQGWMKDESRIWDALLAFKTMRPRIRKEPKGVSLIISAWNYPWYLTLGPLVGAIAAGCPAIVKVSEHAPSSSALLAELLPRYLDPEGYAVVLGAVDETTRLLEKPWGHIVYTGSGGVGKIVATAAAKTLTPTTLELGGKCPVIVSSCANFKITAKRMFTIKQMGMGQMCVSPDYVLVEKNRVDEFIDACKEVLNSFYPPSPSPQSHLHSPQSSSLRYSSDLDRILSFLDDADRQGKLVHRGELDRDSKRLGISLVRLNEYAAGESGGLVDEEVFGPVMGIIPVENIDAAIRYVNEHSKPLALYVCSSKKSVFQKVISETSSGSATWNDFGLATIARNLPFGGVGESGWGSYHGKDGFNTFTHHKSVMEVPYLFEPLMAMRYPPLSNFSKRVFRFLLCTGVSFRRPVSVEGEAKRLRRKKVIKWMSRILVLLVVAAVGGGLGLTER